MKFALLYGSHRHLRQGIKAARFIESKLKERSHEVYFVDAMELDLPLLDKKFADYEKGTAPEKLEKLAEIYSKVDGFVVMCGEYNVSIPPGLMNLLDYFHHDQYAYKASAIASYSAGPFGGVRSAMHMRSVLVELGMPPIPKVFPMSAVYKDFDEDGKAVNESYNDRVVPFLEQLEWYARALKAEREKGTPA